MDYLYEEASHMTDDEFLEEAVAQAAVELREIVPWEDETTIDVIRVLDKLFHLGQFWGYNYS